MRFNPVVLSNSFVFLILFFLLNESVVIIYCWQINNRTATSLYVNYFKGYYSTYQIRFRSLENLIGLGFEDPLDNPCWADFDTIKLISLGR